MAAELANETGTEATTDEELARRLVDGDERAFDVLYRRYFKRIYGFVDKRLRNRADTEETVQEVFVAVFSSIQGYRGEAPLAAWVLGLTRRTIAARFKRKRHTTVPLLPDEEPETVDLLVPVLSHEATPLEHYECSERLRLLERAAEQLTPEQWQLFERHHLENQSIVSLAEHFDKSQDAIKSTLYRARKILLAR